MIPSLPSPGNHEYDEKSREEIGRDSSPSITGHWRAQFALPQNGPKGLEETAYFVDYQGARIISLNSNEGLEKQADWLHEILGRNPNRWTVITFHHPIYSSAKERDNAQIRQLWQPIFDKYHVDLVLQGHDHTYARTGLQTASAGDSSTSAANPGSGTVYVNSVAGPKQYAWIASRSRSGRPKEPSSIRSSPSTATHSGSKREPRWGSCTTPSRSRSGLVWPMSSSSKALARPSGILRSRPKSRRPRRQPLSATDCTPVPIPGKPANGDSTRSCATSLPVLVSWTVKLLSALPAKRAPSALRAKGLSILISPRSTPMRFRVELLAGFAADAP